jgi:DNA-binding PadR family transcriptional regulator
MGLSYQKVGSVAPVLVVTRRAGSHRYRNPISTIVSKVREFLRGAVRLHILHHAARQDVHGAWMAAELARHGYRISPGSLYPTLHKMEAAGIVRSRWQTTEGRRRRVYRITPRGRRLLETSKRQLRELADEVLEVDGR